MTDPDVVLLGATGVGLLFLVLGLANLSEVITEWIITNTRDPLEAYQQTDPGELWGYRLRALVQFACGYILAFRAPTVASYLRRHAR